MLQVLRHYFSARKALLVVSETVILTLLVHWVMSRHLAPGAVTERLSMELAHLGLSPRDAWWRVLSSSLLVSVLAQVAISFNELYDFRISSSRYDRAARFVGSAGSAIVLVLAAVVLVDVWGLERVIQFPGLPLAQETVVLTFTLMAGFALLWLWRHVFHFALRRWNFNERVLILGAGRAARTLIEEILRRPDSGYEVVGMVSGDAWLWQQGAGGGEGGPEVWPPDAAADESDPGPPPRKQARRDRRRTDRERETHLEATALETSAAATLVLERELREPSTEARGEQVTESLYELTQRLGIHTISVALEDRRGTLPTAELLRCRLQGVEIEEGDSIYERITGKIAVQAMRPSYLIFNRGFVRQPSARAAKRLLDLVLALLVLLVTWPLMILTAIAVRLDSPGPILFRQERTGTYGRPFTLMKFRSMRSDAEAATGPVWATADDPRITRVGGFLRKSRLDELPQLFNVLGGSMSLVGPRPERPHFVAELSKQIPYYSQRHLVKPGLTGWAQINYPYGNTIEDAVQKLQYDLFYAKHQSLVFDLSILFSTIKTVVLRRGT